MLTKYDVQQFRKKNKMNVDGSSVLFLVECKRAGKPQKKKQGTKILFYGQCYTSVDHAEIHCAIMSTEIWQRVTYKRKPRCCPKYFPPVIPDMHRCWQRYYTAKATSISEMSVPMQYAVLACTRYERMACKKVHLKRM